MTNKLNTIQARWMLAVGLMLALFPLSIYVNSRSRTWGALAERLWPDLAVQFLISTLITYGWIRLAEWLQRCSVRCLGDFYKAPSRIWLHILAASVFLSVSMAAVLVTIRASDWLYYVYLGFPYPADADPHTHKATIGQFMALSLCIYVIIANRHVMQSMEAVQLRAEQLEKESVLTQFGALKSQVNPHFLFNSLSILSTLVKKDAARSELFIDRLSKAYRYILEQRDTDVVPLRSELAFLQAYVYLLKTRFENKFEVQVSVPEGVQDRASIPPLTLQMLVENAVKHNRMSEKEPLVIRVETDGDYLVVSNPLQPRKEAPATTGIGLQNIINRYALLTDRPVWAGEREGAFLVRVGLL